MSGHYSKSKISTFTILSLTTERGNKQKISHLHLRFHQLNRTLGHHYTDVEKTNLERTYLRAKENTFFKVFSNECLEFVRRYYRHGFVTNIILGKTNYIYSPSDAANDPFRLGTCSMKLEKCITYC